MLVVRIDKHPSNGDRPEHVETVTIANVNELDGIHGVWRNGRSIQEAPDYTIQAHALRPSAQTLVGIALTDPRA